MRSFDASSPFLPISHVNQNMPSSGTHFAGPGSAMLLVMVTEKLGILFTAWMRSARALAGGLECETDSSTTMTSIPKNTHLIFLRSISPTRIMQQLLPHDPFQPKTRLIGESVSRSQRGSHAKSVNLTHKARPQSGILRPLISMLKLFHAAHSRTLYKLALRLKRVRQWEGSL